MIATIKLTNDMKVRRKKTVFQFINHLSHVSTSIKYRNKTIFHMFICSISIHRKGMPNNNKCIISTDWNRYNHLKFSFTSVIKSFLSVGLELHKNVTIIINV